MVTLDQLKGHIDKAQTKAGEAVKKAGDSKYDLEARKARKKLKRLTRKAAKMVYFEKNTELKKKSKKERKAAAEG